MVDEGGIIEVLVLRVSKWKVGLELLVLALRFVQDA
jgi:hypothetical protein